MKRKLPLQVRIDYHLEAPLKKLAKENRRSLAGQVNAIVSQFVNAYVRKQP